MKKIVSTILILLYVFASVGFASIHYYCNMSMDNSINTSSVCMCASTGMEQNTQADSCCGTGDTEYPAHDFAGQPDGSQIGSACCSIEITYHQADDVVLKITELQKFIQTNHVENLLFSELSNAGSFFTVFSLKAILLFPLVAHRPLPGGYNVLLMAPPASHSCLQKGYKTL